jgi:hypothetical protein
MTQAIRRRALLGSTAALLPTLALGGCGYRSEYALSWDEEVLLHDGTMIVVHVTRYFWRDFQLPTFQSFYVLRDMEIAFDAGPPWGRYRRRFTGYSQVSMIDRMDGNWYISIAGDPGIHRITNPLYPFWILSADGKERPAVSAEDIPSFPRLNVLPFLGPQDRFFSFKGSRLKWDQKMAYWRANPRSGGDTPDRPPYKPASGTSR